MPSTTVVRTAAVPGRELRRRAALLAAALLAVLALVLGAAVAGPADGASAAVPAAAAGQARQTRRRRRRRHRTELEYAAVGDSFAVGTGAGSLPHRQSVLSKLKSHPKLLDADANLHLRVLLSMLRLVNGGDRRPGRGHRPTARVVTVTVGRNDVGFDDVMLNCFLHQGQRASRPSMPARRSRRRRSSATTWPR